MWLHDPIFAVLSIKLLLGTVSMKDLLFIDILIMVIQWDYCISSMQHGHLNGLYKGTLGD